MTISVRLSDEDNSLIKQHADLKKMCHIPMKK